MSAGSDKLIKVWDMRTQRCVHTYAPHSDSVWTLAFDQRDNRIVSGGRDQCVYHIDMKKNESCLLLKASHPITSFAITNDRSSIWVATTNSNIEKWDFEDQLKRSVKDVIISPISGSWSFSYHGSPCKRKSSIHSSYPQVTPKETIPGSLHTLYL